LTNVKGRTGEHRRGAFTVSAFSRTVSHLLWITAALPIAFFLLILSCSCGQGASWSEALESTSPSNPREGQIGPFGTRVGASSRPEEEEAAGTAVEESSGSEQAQEGPLTLSFGSGATVELALEGDLSCIAGEVRCSLDGRYAGVLIEGRTIKIELDPGRHLLEAWDNRGGRWLAEFEIGRNGEARLPLRCADRRAGGDF
jgi:hypothetical protein